MDGTLSHYFPVVMILTYPGVLSILMLTFMYLKHGIDGLLFVFRCAYLTVCNFERKNIPWLQNFTAL